MEPAEVLFEKTDRVGIITLNRPQQYNAMNRSLVLKLAQGLEDAAADDEVKVVLLTGAGKAFCVGGDLKGHPSFETTDPLLRAGYLREAGRIVSLIHQMPKPVIAAVNGAAAGAGLTLALACDLRVASDAAGFTASFAKAGLMPDMGGTFFLPRIVGLGRALEMILSGEKIDAQEALRIGLINKVFPASEAAAAALCYAKKMAQGPGQAYKMTKWAVYSALGLDLEGALKHEELGQALLLGTPDVGEAVQAFLEKRGPVFG